MGNPQLCGAKTRAGGTCKRAAMRGSNRCDFHGGKSPQAQRKAAERLLEQRAQAVLAALGEDVAPVTDALTALEDIAGQVMALVGLLKTKVAQLTEIRYSSGMGLEQVRSELSVYLSALTRAESVLGRIISLDLEGRRVTIEEAKVAAVVLALDKVLASPDLALDAERQRRGRQLLARALGAQGVSKALAVPIGVSADQDRNGPPSMRSQVPDTEDSSR